VLAGIVSQEAMPAAARVTAAGILLDRGWGKPAQTHKGEVGDDIRVTIRTIIEAGCQEAVPPAPHADILLDHPAPQSDIGEDDDLRITVRRI
jgi:hypothetical protein